MKNVFHLKECFSVILIISIFLMFFSIHFVEAYGCDVEREEKSRVNTYTARYQENPDASILADENYVVIWQSDGQDRSSAGIFGQIMSKDGKMKGREFQVNTYTIGDQKNPRVDSDSKGNFVVVWESYEQDGSGLGIFAQRFDSEGNKIGNEFYVNTYTNDNQKNPRIKMSSEGNFIIIWTQEDQFAYRGDFAQLFDRDGKMVGGEFQIINSNQYYSSVIMKNDSKFSIIYSNKRNELEMFYQKYDMNGNREGNPILLKNLSFFDSPIVKQNSRGDFIFGIRVKDESKNFYDFYAWRYDFDGTENGKPINIDTNMDRFSHPDLALNEKGETIVNWAVYNTNIRDYDLFGQRIDSNGRFIGEAFWIDSTPYSIGNRILLYPNSDFISAELNDDGSDTGIFSLHYGWCKRHCSNGIKDENETDIDCGKSCYPCSDGSSCASSIDCENEYCNPNDKCLVQSCSDGFQNQNEEGIDCGGPCMNKCELLGFCKLLPDEKIKIDELLSMNRILLKSLNDDTYIAVWIGLNGTDLNSKIHMQRFDMSGNAISELRKIDLLGSFLPFDINSNADLALDKDNNFILVWSDVIPDNSATDIYAQKFDKFLNPLSAIIKVNNNKSSNYNPRVSVISNDNFIVLWEIDNIGKKTSILQKFNKDGNKIGNEITLGIEGNAGNPQIKSDMNGNYIITWMEKINVQGQYFDNILAKLFDKDGNILGKSFRINDNPIDSFDFFFNDYSIDMNKDGNFVVSWDVKNISDFLNNNLYAAIFDSNGNKIRNEFIVNLYNDFSNIGSDPIISINDKNRFIISGYTIVGAGGCNYSFARFDQYGNRFQDEYYQNLYVFCDRTDKYLDIFIDNENNIAYGWIDLIPSPSLYVQVFRQRCGMHCDNNIIDGDEIGLDCGGTCPGCSIGSSCKVNVDCMNLYCNPNGICSNPICADGWKNGDETDIDCGGPVCQKKCEISKSCIWNEDCLSNYCNPDTKKCENENKLFIRGNPNGGPLDLGDAVFILNYLFASGQAAECLDSADVDDDGQLTIGDAIYLLNYMFVSGPAPPTPFPDTGTDPTQDGLAC